MSIKRRARRKKAIEVNYSDILFECPSCQKSIVIDASAEGSEIICPKCSQKLIVPGRAPLTPAQLENLVELFLGVVKESAETQQVLQLINKELGSLEISIKEIAEDQRRIGENLALLSKDILELAKKRTIVSGGASRCAISLNR